MSELKSNCCGNCGHTEEWHNMSLTIGESNTACSECDCEKFIIPASPPVDSDRLLTDEEIKTIGKKYAYNPDAYNARHLKADKAIAKTQRDLTASLKETEMQKMAEQIREIYQEDFAKLQATHKAEVENIQKLVNEALGISSERSPRWRSLVLKLEEIQQALKASVEGET